MVDGEPWPGLGHAAVPRGGRGASAVARPRDLPARTRASASRSACGPAAKQPAAALCRLNPDGSITITTGVVDMSGTTGAFQIIAAETFGLDPSTRSRSSRSTRDGAPQSPLSGGSVITYSSGRAIREAAADARRQLLAYAALEMEIDPADLEIVDGIVHPASARRIRAGRSPSSPRSCATSAASSRRSRATPATVQASLAPSTAAHIAHVRSIPRPAT